MSSSSTPNRCQPPYHPDPGESKTLEIGRKMYLVCGKLVRKPGVYTSWPSADAQFKGVSGATLKGYYRYDHLLAAWHARCALGEHGHGVDPHHADSPPCLPPSSQPPPPASRATEPAPSSPPRPVYWIESRTPSPISRTSSLTSQTYEAPPAYTAIYGNHAPSTSTAKPAT
ncbi:hypothetical protein B0H12DRAFT_1246255 [Mycena haematopus]|nr:hypothetical protein B0H12DRAFT_1246255 [Mycena haematopus]